MEGEARVSATPEHGAGSPPTKVDVSQVTSGHVHGDGKADRTSGREVWGFFLLVILTFGSGAEKIQRISESWAGLVAGTATVPCR